MQVAIGEHETLSFRDGNKLYCTVWYEDPDYREETVVRSLNDGTVLDRFPGDIRIMPNGEKWLVREFLDEPVDMLSKGRCIL